MKRFIFWVLCLCGLLLAIAPVSARQVALSTDSFSHLGPLAIEYPVDAGVPLTSDSSGPSVQPAIPYAQILPNGPGEGGEMQPFDQAIEGMEPLAGLFTLYRHPETGKTYLEIQPHQLNRNFLTVTTLASGIGELGLYSGWPISDFLFQFRHVQNKVQLVIPNIYFRTSLGDPQQRSVARSFSDSVLYALDILSINAERQSLLIDIGPLFGGDRDLPGLMAAFPWVLGESYSMNPENSYIRTVKVLPQNVEIESIYGFSGGANPFSYLNTLPDQRAFSLSVHYSLSELPTANGYQPRLADDRVGYFITAYQNLSERPSRSPFVRHIWRWKLEPQDPSRALSPAKEPIVFWLENTVPLAYRDALREGALMWNEAFAAAGIQNALEVRQMPDDADWEPEDVRYNTIRWSNSFEGGVLGLGPSRINPLTGQILDADIIIDANAVRYIQENFGTLIQNQQALTDPASAAAIQSLCAPGMQQLYLRLHQMQSRLPAAMRQDRFGLSSSPLAQQLMGDDDRCFGATSARQMGFGSMALSLQHNLLPSSEELETYVHQYLRYLTAHEVGHTLGLRHNFRGSTMLSPDQLNDPTITQTRGLVGSVMDYVPVNLASEGVEQGDYFPTVLGPYDRWAIEYGYKPLHQLSPQAEWRDLQRIAQRAAEPGLSYATDEDSYDFLMPEANAWDLSSDMLGYSREQMDMARQVWQRLDRRYPLPGESYSDLRDRFNAVLFYYADHAMTATRYIGGQTFNRDRRGDPGGRQPFEPIPLEQQRQALETLQTYMFAPDAFSFSPELINQLAPSRWSHWGSNPAVLRLDYPIYDNIQFLQSLVLADLLSSDRLARLRDGDLRTRPGEALTIAELFETLQTGIWSEVVAPDRNAVNIASLRRGLQRKHMDILINMVLRNVAAIDTATNFPDFLIAMLTVDAPDDARVMARYSLRQIEDSIGSTLRRHRNEMDTATQAHLEEARDRISKALDAPLQSS